MLKTRHLIFIFIPALLLAAFVLFIRVLQYEPMYPKNLDQPKTNTTETLVPVYPEDPIIGNRSAKQTLVIFGDYGCAKCKAEIEMLATLMGQYPNQFKIVWKGLAVQRFPYSTSLAHEYAFCANKQKKFLDFMDETFANSDDLSGTKLAGIVEKIGLDQTTFNSCVQAGTAKEYNTRIEQLAQSLNIQVVPTIFLNGQQIATPQIIEEWQKILNLINYGK